MVWRVFTCFTCLWCPFVLLLLFVLHHTLAITLVAPTIIAVTGPTASPRNIAAKPSIIIGTPLLSWERSIFIFIVVPIELIFTFTECAVKIVAHGCLRWQMCHELVLVLCKSLEPLMLFIFFCSPFLLFSFSRKKFVNILKSMFFVLFIYLFFIRSQMRPSQLCYFNFVS